MLFGRKISNRLTLAALLPAVFMFAAALLLVAAGGEHFRRRVFAAALAAALVLAFVLGRMLMRPIGLSLGYIRRNAERMERGDYSDMAGPQHEGAAPLEQAFSRMAAQIAQREAGLREQNQALAANSHRFEAVLNATHDGIAMLDHAGRFVVVNRRFGELLDSRAESLISQMAAVQPLLHGRLDPPDGDGPQTRGVREQIIDLEDDGPERRSLQLYTAPVQGEDGRETIGCIIALRDITRERELDKLKTDFISVVSHELRTPLTSIKGYTDLLLSGVTGEISELQGEFLGIIQSSTTRLSNLINDILDISRIESGSIEIKHEPIDYRRIVADTLRLMKAAADEKQISMDASLPESIPPVRGDVDKVAQVLSNLVSNAIKYTPEGGWVKLGLEVTGEASVLTSVADSGIGISPADQKRLFQKFFRADNTSTREAGGTGLGLVIAKTIVELLGGAIWVESEAGRGTRFYFTLPLYLEAGGTSAAPALPDRGIGLVLIVDDDSYVRSLIRHALHRRGYGTLEAADCEEALQKARRHKPDAITLDMMMPDMDGLRALRALKSDRAAAAIPVVLVSVLGDPSRGEFTMGAFSFLQKPLDAARVCAAILAAVSGRSGTPKALAVCPPETDTVREFAEAASQLQAKSVHLEILPSAPEAVAYVITEAPALILLDTAMPDAEMFALLTALKAEEEAARIPVVLLTDDISQQGIHFHLGSDAADHTILLDYLCEQVSRAISVRGADAGK